MKIFALFAVFCASLLTPAYAASPAITFMLGHTGWVFSVSAEGRLDAQYGSSYGDHAFLPDGTVDVLLLQALLKTKLLTPGSPGAAQVALEGKEEALPLSDDSLLRYLVLNKTNKWQFSPGADEKRVRELMLRISFSNPL